jgi:hypothetical protein
MRSAAIDTERPAVVLNGVVIQLWRMTELRAIEWDWPWIARSWEDVIRRVGVTRRRGGSTASVAGPVAWLDQVVRDHPEQQKSEAVGLREELLTMVDRIRAVAGL